MFTTYMDFNGNGKEALALYHKAFGGEIVRQLSYKDMPPNPDFPVLPHQENWLLNGELEINGARLLMSDSENYHLGNNMKINITENEQRLKEIWDVLKDGATNLFELTPTFFSPLHGGLTDKFGVRWLFTAPVEEDR